VFHTYDGKGSIHNRKGYVPIVWKALSALGAAIVNRDDEVTLSGLPTLSQRAANARLK